MTRSAELHGSKPLYQQDCASGNGMVEIFEYYCPHRNLNTYDRLHFGGTRERTMNSLQTKELL